MKLSLSHLTGPWLPAVVAFLHGFTPRETEPPVYPFAPLDVAQLERLTGLEPGAALDGQTWRDLLLDRYADSLSDRVSIFGRQALHRRLRGGVDDAEAALRRERIERLLREPARIEALHETIRPLRRAAFYASATGCARTWKPTSPWPAICAACLAGAGPRAATAMGSNWKRACIRCWTAPAGCR
jgi:phosphoglycolate phosphatase-like HAD superfamily hydrolase